MRRLLAAVALAAVALTGSACSGGSAEPNAPAPTSAAASPTAAAAAGNTKQVCAAAQKAITDALTQLLPQLQSALSSAKDPASQAAAVKTFEDFLKGAAATLRGQAATATEADLKKALNDNATALDSAVGKVKFSDLADPSALLTSTGMQSASAQLDKFCPGP